MATARNDTASHETVVLGGGCFWCLEAVFQHVIGVSSVTSGYAGGTTPSPTYDSVCTGTTGHAEVVEVMFDPSEITLEDILDIFWAIHDPTTKNRQGSDSGTQYRSLILTTTRQQQKTVVDSIKRAQAMFDAPIVTEVASLETFYPAEAVHTDFYRRNSESPYCRIVIDPKLQKLMRSFRSRVRES